VSNFKKAILGLEIFSIGTHTDSGGNTNTFTSDDVEYMVSKFASGYPEFVPIKLGHTSDEFNRQVAVELGLPPASLNGENGEGLDGVAALGQVVNLYTEGDKLVADLRVPDEMVKLFDQEYFRDVSCELSVDNQDRWILDGLAMLGAERPAVGDLAGIAAAAVHKKRTARVVHSFSQALPKKVNMSEQDQGSKIDKILGLVSGDKISFSDLESAGLKFGDEADKGAVKDAVRELQERSSMLDEVVGLLQQAIEITSTAAEEGDEIVEEDVAAEPAVAAKALVGRLTTVMSSGTNFKQGADFKAAVASAVKESTKELVAQVATLSGDKTVANYRVETEKLVGMEGTPQELAEKLADLESKAGKETATAMLSSWKQVSTFAVESGQFKAIGEGEGEGEGVNGEPSDLEREASEFKAANPSFSESQALSAVRLRRMRSVREAK